MRFLERHSSDPTPSSRKGVLEEQTAACQPRLETAEIPEAKLCTIIPAPELNPKPLLPEARGPIRHKPETRMPPRQTKA